MSAAVARPPLFSHLVASNPQHERGSLFATLASVVLHTALIAAAIMFVKPAPPQARVVEIIDHIIQPVPPAPVEQRQARTGGSVGNAPSNAPVWELPTVPDISTVIPKPGTVVIEDPGDIVGRIPSSNPGGTTNQRPGGIGGGENAIPFTPFTVAPQLLNRVEVARLLQRLYPNMLLSAGIGGTVVTWIKVNEQGAVVEVRLSKTSGQRELDQVAMKVAEAMKFSPAYNRDVKVPVWVELPVVFNPRDR